MKYGWVVLLVLAAVIAPGAAHGQAAIYAEFSASQLSGGPQGDYLYGGQAGALIDGPKIFGRVLLQTDIQGRFVTKNGEMLDSAVIGPRFSVTPKFLFKLQPFAEFNVGFGRYNDGANNSSTDYMLGVQGGVARPVSAHLDAVVDYSWAQFGYNFGFYQPQSYSGGVIYHFTKR